MTWTIAGSLTVVPAPTRTDLLAEPVAKALAALAEPDAVGVAEIDPSLADTIRGMRNVRVAEAGYGPGVYEAVITELAERR